MIHLQVRETERVTIEWEPSMRIFLRAQLRSTENALTFRPVFGQVDHVLLTGKIGSNR